MKWTSELMRGFLALVVVFGFFGSQTRGLECP